MSKSLWRAIGEKRYKNAIYEVENGQLNVTAKFAHGWTCLHASCERGYDDITERLIAMGADVNLQDWSGDTPLHLAANRSGTTAVKLLLAVKARQTANHQGRMPCHYAAAKGNNDVLQVLLSQNKIIVNVQDISGRIALHNAAENGHLKTVMMLIQSGSDPGMRTLPDENGNGQTPSELAHEAEHMEIVRYLSTVAKSNKTTEKKSVTQNPKPTHDHSLNTIVTTSFKQKTHSGTNNSDEQSGTNTDNIQQVPVAQPRQKKRLAPLVPAVQSVSDTEHL